MAAFDDLYATDESVARRSVGDYPQLAPRHNSMANGRDGVIDSSDRWTLVSAETDFEEQGVEPGHVFKLEKHTQRVQVELFGVTAVNGHSATLKRIGKAAGVGAPPGPVAAATAGIAYDVVSVEPQIRDTSTDIASTFRLGSYSTETLTSLGVSSVLEELTSYWVLEKLYFAKSQQFSGGTNTARRDEDDYAGKAKYMKSERERVYALLESMLGTGPASPGGKTILMGRLPQADPTPPMGLPSPGDEQGWGRFKGYGY